jgi:hypothetical protein
MRRQLIIAGLVVLVLALASVGALISAKRRLLPAATF